MKRRAEYHTTTTIRIDFPPELAEFLYVLKLIRETDKRLKRRRKKGKK